MTRDPISRAAVAGLAAVRSVVGVEPPTCPWRAFGDPRVREVLRCFRWYEKGQVREAWGDDPPAWLVQALDIFARALDTARADIADIEHERRQSS